MATSLPESFQLIFHDSLLGVAVLLGSHAPDLENALMLYANPALLVLLRAWQPERHDLINMIGDLATGIDGETLLPFAIDKGASASLITCITMREDQTRWLEIRTQPTIILGERGHFFWVNDITATKEQEIVARRQAAIADAAAQAKSNFLATMSHEIRTPLQTIFGMLELLNEDAPTPHQADMINAAKSSANGLLGILDDILDLAKVEAGKMELDAFDLPLRTLVYGVMESLEAKRRETNIFMVAEIAPDVPPVLTGDPKRLRQIFTNLLGNALKFTEQGGITVRVSVASELLDLKAGEIGLRVEVEDTGIGMTGDVAKSLFQPFVQADSTTTRRFGGTGLGLSIASRFVDRMGGRMGVVSTPGQGSTFWFEIPTTVAADTADTALPDLTGLTILSIEDHPQGAKEIQQSLHSMGATVTWAGTAGEGLALAGKRPFDVAVVDQGLPDGKGTDVLRELNRVRPYMGLVLYTIHDDDDITQLAKFVGAKHLAKPASRRGLGNMIKRAARHTHQLSDTGPHRLLLCEDNAAVRDVLQRQLKILEVEADFVHDGQQAWNILQEKRHSILITDLHMPVMDGYSLVGKIRDTEENTGKGEHFPVIAMTADVQLVHEQSYLKHGFDECLLKPVSLGQIRQLLVRWHLLQEKAVGFAAETGNVSLASLSSLTLKVPSDKIIDLDLAILQFGSVDADTRTMIDMFVRMSEQQIADMAQTFEANDWPKLLGLTHSLKGAAYSACCVQLGDIASNIEKQCQAGHVADESFAELVPAFAAVKDVLTTWVV